MAFDITRVMQLRRAKEYASRERESSIYSLEPRFNVNGVGTRDLVRVTLIHLIIWGAPGTAQVVSCCFAVGGYLPAKLLIYLGVSR